MSYHSNSSIIQHEGENWEVNVGDRGQYKICPSHLKKMITQLNIMVEKYPRVFCVVFDLHLPEYSENNAIISDLWRSSFLPSKQSIKLRTLATVGLESKKRQRVSTITVCYFLMGNKYVTRVSCAVLLLQNGSQ